MEGINIPELRYSSFSRRLHSKKESEGVPLEGAIEVTSHCNLNCKHCYIRDNSIEDELSYDEFLRIIDEITDAGCLWLTFTGGEPFIRRDFLDIYTYAKRKGLLIVIFTNGTLITPQIADYLKEFKPFYLEISLYGMSRETYKNVTGSADNYDRCMDAISLFMERKVLFRLKSVLIKQNKHEIFKMKSFARRLGVDFRFDLLINPRIDGGKAPCDVRVTPEEGVNMEMADKEVRKEWAKAFAEIDGKQNPELLFSCGAGQNLFNIDSQGNLQICNMVRYINYDLRKGSFNKGWNLFPGILSRKVKGKSKCATCKIDYFCNRCPGWSMMEYGDEEAPIEYACEIAHLRAEAIFERR
jgi:radical SAM protein with 4Fe4S-binding SPASM domain